MTKKEERKYAKNREEYFREFHRVIGPVVVMKVDGKPTYCPPVNCLSLDCIKPKPLLPREELRGEVDMYNPNHWHQMQMMFQRNASRTRMEQNATLPSDAINNALAEFNYGSNGSTESEELLQLPSDGNQ